MDQITYKAKKFYEKHVVPFIEYIYIHFFICLSLVLDNLGKHEIIDKYLNFSEKNINIDELETKYNESELSFCNNINDIQMGDNVLIIPGLINQNQIEELAINNNKSIFLIQSEEKIKFKNENIDLVETLGDRKFDVIIIGPHLINFNLDEYVTRYQDNLNVNGSMYFETLMYYPNNNTIKEPLYLKNTFTFGSHVNSKTVCIPSFIEVASYPYKIVDINNLKEYMNKDYDNFTNSFFKNDKDIYSLLMRIKMYAKHYKHHLMFIRFKI